MPYVKKVGRVFLVKEGKRHVFLLREKKVICPKVGLVISERERGKTKNKI